MRSPTKNRLRIWFSRIVVILIAVGVLGSIVVLALPKPPLVQTAQVFRDTMTVTLEEEGLTRFKDRFFISAPLAGNLARVTLSPGDPVSIDSIVARLQPLPAPLLDPRTQAQLESQLAAAEARLQQAQAAEAGIKAAYQYADTEDNRQRLLAERGSVPLQTLERAELERQTLGEEVTSAVFATRVARHQVETAQAALSRLASDNSEQFLLPSPVDGIVLSVVRGHAGIVQPGTTILELGTPRAMEIVVDVLTRDAVSIPANAEASIIRTGLGTSLAARVRRVEPQAFTRLSSLGIQEQRVNVILDLQAPVEQWQSLGDGYRVTARITLWQQENVLQVPESALFRQNEQWFLFVVDEGTARKKLVTIGRSNNRTAQILLGVEQGDTVIIYPSQTLVDNTAVRDIMGD